MRELFLSGFADEAADDIEGQIKVIKTLGWKYLEARQVSGFNIHDLDDSAFNKVCAALEEADIQVNCVGSTIANHSTPVDSNLEAAMTTVRRAITRMKRLKVPFIRIMSYAVIYGPDHRPLADQKEEKRFEQLRKICDAFLDAGLTPLHENAFNYGSMSWEHTLKLLDAVPGLKLIYDTGDSGVTADFRKPYPYPSQDCREVWEHIKDHVVHLHIKDGCRELGREPTDEKRTYFYPGMGDCEVQYILADALSSGYSGILSIEPNMVAGLYDWSKKDSPEFRFNTFIGYARFTEDFLRGLGCEVRNGTVYVS